MQQYLKVYGDKRRPLQLVTTRDGKEPSLLEFGSVRVLPDTRVRSVRVLNSYGNMKVRFCFGSLCRVFGSVRFGLGMGGTKNVGDKRTAGYNTTVDEIRSAAVE